MPEFREAIAVDGDLWISQFTKQFELNVLNVCRDLPAVAPVSELQLAITRAILATYRDSGVEFESVLELFGHVELSRGSGGAGWNDELNQRRFALIDKEIQDSLTSAESAELAVLTRIMRDHIETEANLPMEGARALHRKLLELQATSDTD